MSSPPDHSKNTYLLWLEHGGVPPVRGSMAKAEEAATWLRVQLLKAKRCLRSPTATWAHWERFALCQKRFESLMGLVQCQALISRRLTPEKSQAWILHWERRQERVTGPMTQGLWRNHLLALAHRQGDETSLREVKAFFEFCGPATAETRFLKKQKIQQEQREKAYVTDRLARGGVHAQTAPSGLSRETLKNAKKAGASRGNVPYLFLPFTSESTHAMAASEQADFRHLLWLEDSHAPIPTLAIEKRRAARQRIAETEGFDHFADYMLRNQAIYPQPEKIVHALRQARKRLRSDNVRLRHLLKDYTNARFPDMEPATLHPADAALIAVEGNPVNQWFDTKKVFPWRETTLKIFGDLLPACGWALVTAPTLSGEGPWSAFHFYVERQSDGRKAHLVYSPFRPHQAGNSEYSAGEAYLVQSGWTPEGMEEGEACVWINQALDTQEAAFNLEELRVICHEIGHALHYLALPNAHHAEPCLLPSDVMEIPSHLLELYPKDPCVLARWASRKGPEAARRSRFWKNKLRLTADILMEHQEALRAAEADLRLCLTPERSLREICEALYKDDGLEFLEEDGSWRRLFLWDEANACQHYTQSMPPSIVRRLVTLTDRGTVNADHVVATYNSLLSEVLETGTTAAQTARNWKAWTGETFATTIHQSLLSHAQQTVRIGRKEMAHIRRKLTVQRKKNAKNRKGTA